NIMALQHLWHIAILWLLSIQPTRASEQQPLALRTEPVPSINITITPVLGTQPPAGHDAVTALNVTMVIDAGRLAAGAPLLELPLVVRSVPTARYDRATNPLHAPDAKGPLPLSYGAGG